MSYVEQTFSYARDYLLNANDVKTRKVPTGAKATFWMFQFPASPKHTHDEVYPGIVIGNHLYARDKGKLKSLGVTHVVNCAKGTQPNQIDTSPGYYKDANIIFYGIKAKDVPSFELSPEFSPAADFIEKALSSGGKVYVHCMMGISRSATIVIAFLMLKRNMSLMEAIKTVRDKREVFPNDGFLHQLCELDSELRCRS